MMQWLDTIKPISLYLPISPILSVFAFILHLYWTSTPVSHHVQRKNSLTSVTVVHSLVTSRFTHQSAQFCSPDWVSVRTMSSMFVCLFSFPLCDIRYDTSRTVVPDQVVLTAISEERPIKYRTPYWSPRGWLSSITLWENIGLSSSRPQTKDEGDKMFGKEPFPFEEILNTVCIFYVPSMQSCRMHAVARNTAETISLYYPQHVSTPFSWVETTTTAP